MTTEMGWDDVIRPAPGVLFREMGGETVLLHLRSGAYFGLDLVGTLIWQGIEQEGRLQPILDLLVEQFEVEEAQAREDLLRMVTQMRDHGLVYVATDGPGEGPATELAGSSELDEAATKDDPGTA